MTVDPSKLQELGDSLTEDQRRLLREGLAGGQNLDVAALAAALNSAENQRVLRSLAENPATGDHTEGAAAFESAAPDGGAPDGGAPDGGAPDGGTPVPIVAEPPLTRW